ncbi:MAG: toxin-antitoxin system HicB family antitoxin [Bacteroidales bacterium]|nr:toxin-antitoxin system HicB family antitoxin [Bacteroidales bacterium]
MRTATRRVQTAFRLDENLVNRLKIKARSQDRSLNALVEEALMQLAPAEPEFPVIDDEMEISPELLALQLPRSFTPEEIAADDRLAYILSK